MQRSALLLAIATSLAAAASGCVDTDAAVFVDPSIASPSAEVSSSALGTALTARFALKLHLGPRASGPSTVGVRAFDLTSADQKTSIVAPLKAASATAFPLEVAPDSDVTADFAVDTGAEGGLLDAAAKDLLCAADGIRVTGTIEDSLRGGATPVASDVFHATCE